LLNPNLRKIKYYTPYNRQVLPTRRNTVRRNPKLTTEGDLQWKMFTNMDNTTGTEWLLEQNGIINLGQNDIIKEGTLR
jgi:hypothetical protein